MAAIHSKDTKPEMIVRKGLWKRGLRYSVNRRDRNFDSWSTQGIASHGTIFYGHIDWRPEIVNRDVRSE